MSHFCMTTTTTDDNAGQYLNVFSEKGKAKIDNMDLPVLNRFPNKSWFICVCSINL